jgi:hypothetical protein
LRLPIREAAVGDTLILVLIGLGFAAFGVTLAYVDWIASRRPEQHPAE